MSAIVHMSYFIKGIWIRINQRTFLWRLVISIHWKCVHSF